MWWWGGGHPQHLPVRSPGLGVAPPGLSGRRGVINDRGVVIVLG